jgi:hypothetical protein
MAMKIVCAALLGALSGMLAGTRDSLRAHRADRRAPYSASAIVQVEAAWNATFRGGER